MDLTGQQPAAMLTGYFDTSKLRMDFPVQPLYCSHSGHIRAQCMCICMCIFVRL